MTFEEFLDKVQEDFYSNQHARRNQRHPISESNQWRYGQALMNVLWQTNRDKYNEITGTEYDCFYLNSIVPKTVQKLKEEWD
jgi:hypothetical protein